jgi:hypothetical protein
LAFIAANKSAEDSDSLTVEFGPAQQNVAHSHYFDRFLGVGLPECDGSGQKGGPNETRLKSQSHS